MNSKTSIPKKHDGKTPFTLVKSTDDRIAEALEEYAAAMESGTSLSKSELLARYTDIAGELTGCLDSLEFIHQVAPQLGDRELLEIEQVATTILPTATLGDFRIIRELGRGGMGVVYEAEQLSLGRRVALKVLPFATMLDKQQLKRFKNEARAAATLDHPNIVSVFSVGEQRGVHYYAMQLIEGRSLAELCENLQREELDTQKNVSVQDLEQAKLDTKQYAALSTLTNSNSQEFYWAVARLGVQAAEALDYSHQQGVIHRDIKPANLLIDSEAKLWVTDFGLARLETDAGMTMTGDLIGTLRYMSPEQALAKRVVVDHRSDVYSLGVTLYELLAQRPAYPTNDRQELLKQIAFEEPTSLQNINPRIPRDLATILYKAIEKNPEDRYATAQMLAEDLGRFLSDRPIIAKQPSIARRVAKWSRRHVGIVWTALVSALALSIVLLASTAMIASLYRDALEQRENAKEESQRAESALAQANEDRQEAIQQRNFAQLRQYSNDISTGQAVLKSHHYTPLIQKLISHVPDAGENDRRGWEWDYLISQAHREERTLDQYVGQYPLDASGVYASWSPDGRYIAAGGWVWNAETGNCFRRLTPSLNSHRGSGSAWSPDSRLLAWAKTDPNPLVHIWNSETDQVYSLAGHEQSIDALVWSPDGKLLATGSHDESIRIWDVRSRTVLHIINCGGRVHDIAWSPDGALLAAGVDGWQVWDFRTEEKVASESVDGEGEEHHYVSWHQDESRLVYSNRQTWRVIESDGWTEVHSAAHDERNSTGSMAYSPDGARLAMVQGSAAVIRDSESYAKLEGFSGHEFPLISVSWAPDGKNLVTADTSGMIKIWQVGQPPQFKQLPTYGYLDWHRDERRFHVVRKRHYRVPPSTYEVPPPSGYWPARIVRNFQAEIEAWDVTTGELLSVTAPKIDPPYSWLPGYQSVATYAVEDDCPIVTVHDVKTGDVVATWKGRTGQTLHEYFGSPNGNVMAFNTTSSDGEGVVEFWDVRREATISTWPRPLGKPTIPACYWTENEKIVAISMYGADVHVISVADATEIYRSQHALGVWPWSPDDRYLVIAPSKGKLEIVDIEQQRVIVEAWPHADKIHGVTWHPNGSRLATCSDDGTFKILSARDGASLLSFSFPEGPVYRVSWSPSGKTLAAAIQGGPIRFLSSEGAEQFYPGGPRNDEIAMAFYRLAHSSPGGLNREALRRFLQLAPDRLGFWEFRSRAHAHLGKFELAAEELGKLVSSDLASSVGIAHEYGRALLAAGNRTTYNQLYARVLAQIERTADDRDRRHLAYHCMLTANPLINPKQTIELARAGLDQVEGFESLTVAGALFRDAQLQESNKLLDAYIEQQLGERNRDYALILALYFRAMIHEELGERSQAIEAVNQAEAIAADLGVSDPNSHEWAEVFALRQEARTRLDLADESLPLSVE